MYLSTLEIVKKANKIVRDCGTRDPYRIARDRDIEIVPCNFTRQRGAYKVIQRNRFIFINENLNPTMKRIVIYHELGHDSLHRSEATKLGGFKEFNIFDMTDNRMEYEANVFASQLELDDDEFLAVRAVPNVFVPHAKKDEQLAEFGLLPEQVADEATKILVKSRK